MEIVSKTYNYFDVEQNLKIAIDDGRVIRLISYAMSSDVENTLDKIIDQILRKFDRVDLKGLVYTCTKELAMNGTKANLKRIFFKDQGLDINKDEDYEKGMAEYKKQMREEKTLEYGKKAKNQGLLVKISLYYSKDVLKIEVSNNTEITNQEETRLREKLAKTMEYEDLMQYYLDNEDDTEGAGMGIALVVILLKGEGIDPNLFRISIHENLTIARIEIPMSKNFKSIRNDHSL
ncbi:MAG: hypothetical protein JW969_15970 [Spirochaetales bacterium]|nr:hypothetical protein [Spirochaetales bacterium]